MILCNSGIRHLHMVVMNLETPAPLFQVTGAKLMNSLKYYNAGPKDNQMVAYCSVS